MNAIEFIHLQFEGLRQLTSATLAGLTEEQLNWSPPGTANSIKVTLLHSVAGEDRFIQGVIMGKPTLWENQGWGARVGVENPPGGGGAGGHREPCHCPPGRDCRPERNPGRAGAAILMKAGCAHSAANRRFNP